MYLTAGTVVNTGEAVTITESGWYVTSDMTTFSKVTSDFPTFSGIIRYSYGLSSSANIELLDQLFEITIVERNVSESES